MNLLTALLPGARQVRAPLAAGAIWLFAFWLALEPGLPSAGHATGIYASLVRLKDLGSGLWAGAVIAFLAYMLGSVSTSVAVFAESRGLARTNSGLAKRLGSPIRGLVVDRVHAAEGRLKADTGFSLGQGAGQPQGRGLFAPPAEVPFVAPGAAWQQIVPSLEWRIRRYGSWRQTKLQLLGKEPELFAEIDRYDAERELRVALLVPMFALTVVVALRVERWYASLAVVVGGLLLIAIMLVQSALARSMSERALVDAVRIGRVHVPLLERLDADVEILRERLGPKDASDIGDSLRST
jgi:hypothetical protein